MSSFLRGLLFCVLFSAAVWVLVLAVGAEVLRRMV